VPRDLKICTTKSTKHCWKKLKRAQINGQTSHAHEFEGLLLVRCPIKYPKLSTDLNIIMKILPVFLMYLLL
jgi:hypothetical protein